MQKRVFFPTVRDRVVRGSPTSLIWCCKRVLFISPFPLIFNMFCFHCVSGYRVVTSDFVRVRSTEMARVYVGNLDPRVTERELEDEFRSFGVLRSVWVARKPPGFAFVDFDDRRDAQDAIRELDGKNGWRVELSRRGGGRGGPGGPGRDRSGGSDMKCYECGESGHFARECRLRVGSKGLGSGRRRSPSPHYRRSPSYGRRSYSPRDRSPKRTSASPRRRSYSRSRSPPYKQAREESPFANGNSDARDERRSRS